MRTTVPILVQPGCESGEDGTLYCVRPLFFDGPQRTDRVLALVMSRLAEVLGEQLRELGKSGRHEDLAAYTFCPDAELHWLEMGLDLRGEVLRGWFPIVSFRHLERTVAFSPHLSEVWFDLQQGDRLRERAETVYTRHFRQVLKQQDADAVQRHFESFRNKKKPWIALLELSVSTSIERNTGADQLLAMLDASVSMDGAEELKTVGYCQDRLHPEQLKRALCRDPLVEQLQGLLAADDRRPVMLVGPPMVGKTTLVQEVVFRRVEQRIARRQGSGYTRGENVWLLAPQRLISGMSYVGQWENRLLAILKESAKEDHVLYFDDVLGLYHAGVTSKSDLSVADVLKPYVERRDVRLLAEITPEQLRVFRERDRGFADLFHLIPIEEPTAEDNLRILVGVARSLEGRYGTRFALDVLPTLLELSHRWQAEAALPGKTAHWLEQLAVKHQRGDVSREAALDAFRARSGMDIAFLDSRAKLDRAAVVKDLHNRIIGQETAVEAMADVVAIAKARLNDPHRPLGTLFFLGPTGVGKTESAKALAQYLFGDAARLLRLDMNEFVSPQSVARLAGTFDQPEGLLTSAIRRQPFAVVLFDEIEKAHPDAFDLLLQILGEARLTDGLGRTANFSSAVVVLTSNLGTRQAARDVGFTAAEAGAESVYRKAVEQFFRPEFFNRLDRIVPFQTLERSELAKIAEGLIADLPTREGLDRRKCTLDLAGDAVSWLVERGCDRVLGARAMRRAIERELVRPLGRQLAAISPETPTVLSVSRRGERLGVQVVPLAEATRLADAARPERLGDPADVVARAKAVIRRLQEACMRHRPADYVWSRLAEQQSPYAWCLGAQEYLKEVSKRVSGIAERLAAPKYVTKPPLMSPKPPRSRNKTGHGAPGSRSVLKEMWAAEDLRQYVRDIATASRGPAEDDLDASLRLLLDYLALAETLGPTQLGWPTQRVLTIVRGLDAASRARYHVVAMLKHRFQFAALTADDDDAIGFGLECQRWGEPDLDDEEMPAWWDLIGDPALAAQYRARYHLDVLVFEGHHAQRFLSLEEGTHLMIMSDGLLKPIQVAVRPLAAGQDPGQLLADCLARHELSLGRTRADEATDPADPLRWQPAVAVYAEGPSLRLVTDFRSATAKSPQCAMMASLPMPPEFADL